MTGRRGPVILVVDDDEDLRETTCDLLRDEGYEPVAASDGAEALRVLAQRRPDLILLDLMMPVMNGWQFRDAQRKDPNLADIPVVVLTANGGVSKSNIDAAAIVLKPVALEALLGVVAEELAR